MTNYEPATAGDKLIEERMTLALSRVMQPILFAMEEQDVQTQVENTRIADAVGRAAWREFRMQCAKAIVVSGARVKA